MPRDLGLVVPPKFLLGHFTPNPMDILRKTWIVVHRLFQESESEEMRNFFERIVYGKASCAMNSKKSCQRILKN